MNTPQGFPSTVSPPPLPSIVTTVESRERDWPNTQAFSRRRLLLLTGGLGLAAAPAAFGESLILAPAAIASDMPLTLNFADYGACDGTTDDRAAFVTALSALAGGGTLVLPPTDIAITLTGNPTFSIPANNRIVGIPGATRILLSSSNNDIGVGFAQSVGDNVAFDGITFIRATNCTIFCIFGPRNDGFHIRNCVVDGQRDTFESPKTMHCILTAFAGTKKNITVRGSTIKRLTFGFIQGNDVLDTCENILVDDCNFTGNFGDDLLFNAPRTTITNVTVSNCRFTDGAATASLGSGSPVDFAHVTNGGVRDCYFENYLMEAIHLEDYCSNVIISGNRIINCGNNTATAGGVMDTDRCGISVYVRCTDVAITGNTLDHRENENFLHAIRIKHAFGVLPSGREIAAPERITITDNIILCGDNYQGISVSRGIDVTVRGNRIVGSGLVTGGEWNDGNAGYGIVMDGVNSVIAGNAVSGFRYGISGPLLNDNEGAWSTRKALGNPGTVTGNLVTDCYVGMAAVSAGSLAIDGNTLSNCVRPVVVGEGEYAALPSSITNNVATGCVYPLEVGGKLVVVRSSGGSTVTTGTEETINVDDTLLKMPANTVISFNGGGTLTLRSAVPVPQPYIAGSPYALVGTVSGTDIRADEYGIAIGLAHSTTAANNYVFIAANTDTAAGS